MTLNSVNGFSLFPVKLEYFIKETHSKATNKVRKQLKSCPHFLYIKPHIGKESQKKVPNERTLFVANIPEECSEWALKTVFAAAGALQEKSEECQVYFNLFKDEEKCETVFEDKSGLNFSQEIQKQATIKSAHIVFPKTKYLKNVFKTNQKKPLKLHVGITSSLPQSPVVYAAFGLEKWKSEFQQARIGQASLMAEVDLFMAEYDSKIARERESRRKEILKNSFPNSEGWVTVVKSSKRKREEITPESQKQRDNKNVVEQLDFYRFQQREARREQVAELRKKFEEDKEKIAKMKASRKFRPF
eukprot:Sdes_comp16052_c0_seq2m5256